MATTLAPDWAFAFATKGYVLACQGELGKAREALLQADCMEPHNEEWKQKIIELNALLERSESTKKENRSVSQTGTGLVAHTHIMIFLHSALTCLIQ